MDKRKVTICTGTACYVLGGADLLLLGSYLTEEMKETVEIAGTPCLGLCKDRTSAKPPFALVDGTAVSEASVQKIMDILSGK
ncbi:MAG: NAD(P)H-dependent oxidoreductase subunit E [Spirochaetota bacterium]